MSEGYRYHLDGVILPTKCRLKSFTVKGVDISRHVVGLNVYESIYKPYITIHAEVLDNTPEGVIKNMGLQAGDPITFSFDAVTTISYDGQVNLLGVKGETKNDTFRATHYVFKGIGPSWVKDQKTIVKQPYQHIPATQVMARIHNDYVGGDAPLRVWENSIGPVDKEVWWAHSIKPFTAIEKLKNRANYPSVRTGSTMYYRDRTEYNIAPLEVMFRLKGSQHEFIQRGTFGRWLSDYENSKDGIVAIHTLVDENEIGRLGATRTASAASQGRGTYDIQKKKNVEDAARSFIGAVGGLIGSGSRHGGRPNQHLNDSRRLSSQQSPSNKSREENAFLAQFSNGIQWAVKVPINTGINVTVGKGVTLKLANLQGDITSGSVGYYTVNPLVTTLVHTMKFDDRQMNGFTAFECAMGGGAE